MFFTLSNSPVLSNNDILVTEVFSKFAVFANFSVFYKFSHLNPSLEMLLASVLLIAIQF